MIVTLDGRRVQRDWPDGATLRAVVDDVRRSHLTDRLIVSISLNGERFAEQDFEQRYASALAPDDQVDLESSDRTQIVVDVLRSVSEELDLSAESCGEIALGLTGGATAESIRQVAQFMSGWQLCRRALVECSQLLERDLTQLEHDGRAVSGHLDQLVEKLRDLRDALDARDLVRLADVIQYEMPELCATWRDLLEDLAGQVRSAVFDAAPSNPLAADRQNR